MCLASSSSGRLFHIKGGYICIKETFVNPFFLKPIAFIFLAFTLILSGCGKDKKSGGATPLPPPIVEPNDDYNKLHNWAGPLQIIDRSTYERFLKDHGICNYPGVIWSFGYWNCKNYDGVWISIHLKSKKVPTQGFAQLMSSYNKQWVIFPPSIIDGTFAPIDQDTGIEIYRRGYDGTPSHNTYFRYRAYGNTRSNTPLTMEVYYRNVKFGQATISPHQ